MDLGDVLLPTERVVDIVAGAAGASLYLVAAGDTAGAIVTVRRRDRRVLDRRDVSGSPTAAAMHPDGHTLLVAVSARNAETQKRSILLFHPLDAARSPAEVELCAGPARALAPFRALDRLYAACDGGELAEVDLALRARIRTASVSGSCGAVGAAMSANGTLIYVLCGDSGALLYVDRARLTLFDSLPVGAVPSSLTLTPGRRRGVVTLPERDEIAIVELRSRTVSERVAFGAPTRSAVSGNGRWAYVLGAEGVFRVDLSRSRVLRRPGPTAPAALSVWPGHSAPIMRW